MPIVYATQLPEELKRAVAVKFARMWVGSEKYDVPISVWHYLYSKVGAAPTREPRPFRQRVAMQKFGHMMARMLAMTSIAHEQSFLPSVLALANEPGFREAALAFSRAACGVQRFTVPAARNACAFVNQTLWPITTGQLALIPVHLDRADAETRAVMDYREVNFSIDSTLYAHVNPHGVGCNPLYSDRRFPFTVPGACISRPIELTTPVRFVDGGTSGVVWNHAYQSFVLADEFGAEEADEDDEYSDDGDDSDYYDDSDGDEYLLDYHSSGESRRNAVRFQAPAEDDPLKTDTLTLGFEAELNVTGRKRCVVELKEALGRVAIFEHDGSLDGERGFETITGWSTLGTVREWGKAYCEVVSCYDYDTESAGLHITTSALTQTHLARVFGFIFARENSALVRFIAGRGFNGYADNYTFCAGLSGKHTYTPRSIAANVIQRAKSDAFSDARYLAIHPRNSGTSDRYRGTVEWRLFRGTGNVKRMLARLEFVWAVTKFVDPARCNELTAAAFEEALVSDPFLRKHTPNLRAYIATSSASTAPPMPALRALHKRIVDKQARRRPQTA